MSSQHFERLHPIEPERLDPFFAALATKFDGDGPIGQGIWQSPDARQRRRRIAIKATRLVAFGGFNYTNNLPTMSVPRIESAD